MPNPVRQYIGARYTVKIYENSLDPSSAEWESGRSWEPLILVTYNNSSYMSKKEVPSNIGNPAANPAYWVCTGYYNGQITQLQQDVLDLQAEDLDIRNDFAAADTQIVNESPKNCIPKRLVIVTDSYGENVGGETSFLTPLQSYMNLSNDDFISMVEGGMGFAHVGNNGHTTYTLLQLMAPNVTSPETITDVAFCMGINDITEDANDVRTGFSNAITYAKTIFTNARVHVGFVSNRKNKNSTQGLNYVTTLRLYQLLAQRLNCHYMTNIEYIMHDARYFQADNLHPTSTAGISIADSVNHCLKGYTASHIEYPRMTEGLVAEAGVTISDGGLVSGIDTDKAIVYLDGHWSFNISGYSWTKIASYTGSVNTPLIWGSQFRPIIWNGYAWTGSAFAPVQFRYYNGDIYANALGATLTIAGEIRTEPKTFDLLYI